MLFLSFEFLHNNFKRSSILVKGCGDSTNFCQISKKIGKQSFLFQIKIFHTKPLFKKILYYFLINNLLSDNQ
jgi:hypothetical protein